MIGALILVLLEVAAVAVLGSGLGAIFQWLGFTVWWRTPLWCLLVWISFRTLQDLRDSITDYRGLHSDLDVAAVDYWPRAAAGLLTQVAVVLIACYFLFA